MEYGHGVLHGRLGRNALDALYHYALCLLVGGHLGVVHDVVDVAGGRGLGLVLEAFYQFLASLVGTESGDALQFLTSLTADVLQLLAAGLQHLLAVVQIAFQRVQFALAALVLALHLVQLAFALLGALLRALGLLQFLLRLTVGLGQYLHLLLLGLELHLFLDHVGLSAGFLGDAAGVALSVRTAHVQAAQHSGCRRKHRYDDPYCCSHFYCVLYRFCL